MTVDEIQSLVFDSDEKDFIRHRLFGPDCWLFDQQDLIGPTATYQGFRNSVADLIDINPNEVSLVRSAKFGVSMSPTKSLIRN